MKSSSTFALLATLCLISTGCSRFQVNNKESELSFYDPFAEQESYAGYESSHYSDVGSPVGSTPTSSGRVRLTDIEPPPSANELYPATHEPVNLVAQAMYPETVDTNMTLQPFGQEDVKPSGSTLRVPADLQLPGDASNGVVSIPDQFADAGFGADPFATASVPQDVDSAGVSVQMPVVRQQPEEFVDDRGTVQSFVLPASHNQYVETVSVPVDADAPPAPEDHVVGTSDGFTPTVQPDEAGSGWRKTR